MAIVLKNNAVTTTVGDLSSIGTSLTVASGTGALFPILGTGDYFFATLQSVTNNFEVIKVTARTDDVMTIVRGQEGTLGIPFLANSRLELRVTVQNIKSAIVDSPDIDFLLL
jgi:hypothetical protein